MVIPTQQSDISKIKMCLNQQLHLEFTIQKYMYKNVKIPMFKYVPCSMCILAKYWKPMKCSSLVDCLLMKTCSIVYTTYLMGEIYGKDVKTHTYHYV